MWSAVYPWVLYEVITKSFLMLALIDLCWHLYLIVYLSPQGDPTQPPEVMIIGLSWEVYHEQRGITIKWVRANVRICSIIKQSLNYIHISLEECKSQVGICVLVELPHAGVWSRPLFANSSVCWYNWASSGLRTNIQIGNHEFLFISTENGRPKQLIWTNVLLKQVLFDLTLGKKVRYNLSIIIPEYIS
jgi:hypothetical protein